MKKFKYVLALDPSGNYKEGNGTTGWVLLTADEKLLARGWISAKDFNCREAYWNAHVELIRYNNKKYGKDLIVVLENYVLYRDRSQNQTNSELETPRLLGVIQWACWQLKQNYTLQLAANVKQRWSDDLLFREHILYKDRNVIKHTESNLTLNSKHERDAFRHGLHFILTRNGIEKNDRKYEQIKGVNGNVRSNYQSRPGKTKSNTSTTRNNKRHSSSTRVWFS